MKRLVRFLALFGFGLLALVLALGPGRLFRRTTEPTIGTSDLGGVRSPIQVADPTEKGRAIGVTLQGGGRIPFWNDLPEADGSTVRVKAALLEYPNPGIEAFAGGFHITQPMLTLYPGKQSDEKPIARVHAAGADVAMRGDASQASQLLQGAKGDELGKNVREFALGPGVVFEQLDADGNVTQTFETERLEAPESAVDAKDGALFASRLVAPGAVHLFRADQTFDLRASGMELDRAGGRVTFRPPLSITGSEFELPGNGPAKPATTRPPVTLTADGPATFVRKSSKTPKPATTADDPLGMQGVLGPGELVFTKNVYVKQRAADGKEQWLRTDRVVVVLDQDESGKRTVTSFDAGVPETPLTFGLLGGEGSGAALHWKPASSADATEPAEKTEQAVVLDGPVAIRDLLFGEGKETKRLSLSAKGTLVARELAADEKLPARRSIELIGAAHAELPGELAADADRLVALVVPPADSNGGGNDNNNNGGSAGSAKLLAVDLFASEKGDVPATADLGARGRASAQKQIHLVDEGTGDRLVHVAHLEGAARVDVARGFVAGETIDISAPADPKQPTRVTVPKLAAAEVTLPTDAGPFGNSGVGATSGAARVLVLEPLAPCRLTTLSSQAKESKASSESSQQAGANGVDADDVALDVIGRCAYHVRLVGAASDAPDLQTLACNELHLVPDPQGKAAAGSVPSPAASFDVRALGEVVLDGHDPANPMHVVAAFAHTERAKKGARRLVLEGLPASATVGDVTVTAGRIVRDLDTEALSADDEREQVTVRVPEALLATQLPNVRSAVAATRLPEAPAGSSEPATLTADHFVLTPNATAKDQKEKFRLGHFEAHGHVRVARPSSGGSINCRDLVLDGARRFARLDGDDGAPGEAANPVLIEQPRPYAKERVELVTANWIEVRDGGREIDVAPNAVFVLYPEKSPDQLTRVQINASDAPTLSGTRLSFTGGVDIKLTVGGKNSKVPKEATARSERAELLLDRPLDDPKGANLLKLNASQRVHLDYGLFHGEGALLAYDFVTEWMELKEGAQPCSLLGQDEKGEWHATSHFRRMLAHVSADDLVGGAMKLEGLELLVEGPRGR